MIRRLLCALRGHRFCVYRAADATWECRCGGREQTDLEWIQEVMSS